MTAEIDICNMALDTLATDSIVSINGNELAAKLCKRWYDISRRTLLKDLNPSFAIKRAALCEDEDFQPVYGWNNAFLLPHDCLKVWNIEDPMIGERYQIEEGNHLFCDYKGLVHIRYVFDNKDVSAYDDDFIELFALKIASRICLRLTADYEKKASIEADLNKKYLETSYKYGSDNKIKVVEDHRILRSRYGYCEDRIK
jgi:hypothetical protein